MSDLICPYEVYLHDERMTLTEVFTDVISHPYQNLRALLESPFHQCEHCNCDTTIKSKVSSLVGGFRQLAANRSFSGQSVACAAAVAACATVRNGLSDGVLYFLASLAVSRIIPKLAAGFKLLLNYMQLKNSATTSTTFLRRQFVRCVLSLLVLTACGGAALGIRKIVKDRQMMQALSSNAVTDSGFLGATMLLAMLGVRSLGKHFPAFLQLVNATDLREALRDSVARFIGCILELIKKTLKFFTKSDWAALDWCIASCRERYESMPQRDFERGVDFSERLLNAKGSALGFIGSEELSVNIDKACEELKEFDKSRMSLNQHANVAHRLHQLIALRNESEWVATMSKERTPPVGVMFLGPPGVGKSYCVPLFLEAVYKSMVKLGLQHDIHRGVYFTRNSDTEFYDGYTGQPFIYYSDMFRGTLSSDVKARESLARELSELQSLVDTAPYYPPFAFEPTPRKFGKGVAIAPSLVLLTSNYHCVDTLGDSYILARRFPYVYMFLQKSSAKKADLSHLAIYRKKTPFMENGPDTGGAPFSGDYTPSGQFPVWESEMAHWPWADDWEPVDMQAMVREVVGGYQAQLQVFGKQREVNPFMIDDGDGEKGSLPSQTISSEESETGIPLPSGVADPRAFWDMLGSEKSWVDESGVKIKLLQNGFSLRRDEPMGRRQLFRWSAQDGRYLLAQRLKYDEVNIFSSDNNCLFAALQASGVMRDKEQEDMRQACFTAWGRSPNPFEHGLMISSDELGFVAETLCVNISLSVNDDVVVPMNEERSGWPSAHIRHRPDHFTALFPEGLYDGWCPARGGTINGQPLIRGGALSLSQPWSLRELLNMRRKVLCRVDASFLPGIDIKAESLWYIDVASEERQRPPGDPWIVIRDAGALLLIAPVRLENEILVDYSIVHEALADVARPTLAKRESVERLRDCLIIREVNIMLFEELAAITRLSVQSLLSVFGLLVRPEKGSASSFFVPVEPQWWLVHGMVEDNASALQRQQIAQWITKMDQVSEEPVMTCKTRRIILAFKDFWKRNKMPIQVALASVGLYTVYRAAQPAKFCPRVHYTPDLVVEAPPMESYSKNYLLYMKGTTDPPTDSFLERVLKMFKKKPDIHRDHGVVAAHIEDLPEFTVRCPDLLLPLVPQ